MELPTKDIRNVTTCRAIRPVLPSRIFKYDDVKVKTENDTEGYDTLEEAQAELIRRVNLEYTKNHVDELRQII